MLLLLLYLAIALGFSFWCSVAEAVLLSVSPGYIRLMTQKGRPTGLLWQKLRNDLDSSLAAILSLNTIAHTMGAAGVGAQSAQVFGNNYVGITSAILTLLILFFSEIIPKTIGARYWRQLAPFIGICLKYLVILLYPLIWMAKKITKRFSVDATLTGFQRDEFAAMADLAEQEGQLNRQESDILKNMLSLRDTMIQDVMTPNRAVFSLPANLTVETFFHKYDHQRFSRIPIYDDNVDHITGFVLRSDLLLAQARGNSDNHISNYRREIQGVLNKTSLLSAIDIFISRQVNIMFVVDEYGSLRGLVTLEDLLETLLGLEIVDEGDKNPDMQKLAFSLWKRRSKKSAINYNDKA